jgi:hypothetical protein
MTHPRDLEELIALLDDDRELVEVMCREGLLPQEGPLDEDACERARVVRTLVRELEVNWAGVEIIVRMREELIVTRRRIAELLDEDDDEQP